MVGRAQAVWGLKSHRHIQRGTVPVPAVVVTAITVLDPGDSAALDFWHHLTGPTDLEGQNHVLQPDGLPGPLGPRQMLELPTGEGREVSRDPWASRRTCLPVPLRQSAPRSSEGEKEGKHVPEASSPTMLPPPRVMGWFPPENLCLPQNRQGDPQGQGWHPVRPGGSPGL